MIMKLVLNDAEVRDIKALLSDLAGRYNSTDDPSFLDEATVYAQELPGRVRRHFTRFRLSEPESALCLVSGYPIDDHKIGATPQHWKMRRRRSPELEEEILLVLFGSLLGDCIAWSTQQDGHIVHDILPIKGMEHEQLGSGSEELLWWHTEDAFHEARGDYLGMTCLRNIDRVPTTFLPLSAVALPPEVKSTLFERHYTIRPDESHLKKNKSDNRAVDETLAEAYSRIERMNLAPDKIAVLFGSPERPYIRIDPYFMDPVENPKAQQALDTLVRAIDQQIEDLVLEQGDFCFIDNFQGVHGRKPFKARYDGQDRWLKRINITRDLRRSRSIRASAAERVIT
jgi:Fe(II)/alpha-ketoglutarate-dependent arginine beta-hydroxylase